MEYNLTAESKRIYDFIESTSAAFPHRTIIQLAYAFNPDYINNKTLATLEKLAFELAIRELKYFGIIAATKRACWYTFNRKVFLKEKVTGFTDCKILEFKPKQN